MTVPLKNPARTDEGRVIRRNRDGSVSTERTITVGFSDDKGEFYVNIPTMDEKGRQLSAKEATARAIKAGLKDPVTGRSLQRFSSLEEAEAVAKERSKGLGRYGQR